MISVNDDFLNEDSFSPERQAETNSSPDYSARADTTSAGQPAIIHHFPSRMTRLPNDLAGILSFIRYLQSRLAEMAVLHARSREHVDKLAYESEILLALEARAIVKAGQIPAQSLNEVQNKLEIWEMVVGDAETTDTFIGVKLVRSLVRDVNALTKRG
ncbi:MAG: hypothetical protein AAGG56_15150 [Pseudomonadota bacterium]